MDLVPVTLIYIAIGVTEFDYEDFSSPAAPNPEVIVPPRLLIITFLAEFLILFEDNGWIEREVPLSLTAKAAVVYEYMRILCG